MHKMTMQELRTCQLNILDFIDGLCKKHNLKYCIDYGTLLGAVRHKGYIPWDDDIDISMLRDDYDKLIEICKKEPDRRYRLSCVELDPDCMYSFGKFIDTHTVLYELGDTDKGIKTGVFVDVFVYDNAPADEAERNRAFDRLDFLGKLRHLQIPRNEDSLSIRSLLIIALRKIVAVLFPKQYFTKRIVEAAGKFKKLNTGLVSDFTCQYYNARWCVDKKIFEEQIEVDFEGKKYKAPKRYDEWLRLQYGNYMKLPSIEEQKAAQHIITAYIKDSC